MHYPKKEHVTVYIAAPFAHWKEAKAVRKAVQSLQFACMSSWIDAAEKTAGKESLTQQIAEDGMRINDSELASAHLLLAMPAYGEGGEMFCEFAMHTIARKRITVWLGERAILSTFRPYVTCVKTLDEALLALQVIRNVQAQGSND